MKDGKKLNDERITDGLSSFATVAMPMLKRILGEKSMVRTDMFSMWEQIVGKETFAYTFPDRIVFKKGQRCDGVLRVKVSGGGFALELQHRKNIIIEKVNLYFGYNAVSDLKIIQDDGLAVKLLEKSNQPIEEKTLVSNEEQNYIIELTRDVSDANLRESLKRLGYSVFNKEHKKV